MIAIWRLFAGSYGGFMRHDGQSMAAYVAFAGLLSLFPFTILFGSAAAAFLGADQAQAAVDVLFEFAPPHVAETLEPVLRDVLTGASPGLLTISGLFAIYLSSNVFVALRQSFARAYGRAEYGNWFLRRFLAMSCVLMGILVALILTATILLAPLALGLLEQWFNLTIGPWAGAVRVTVGACAFLIFLGFLHRILSARSVAWCNLLPGVVISAAIWMIAALSFSTYLSFMPSLASTYGALAGVAITLIFFYMSGAVIIFGAEINARLMQNEWRD